jgi:hypothetical protein
MPSREELEQYLNLAALAYAMLLVVQFALSAYRELLGSHYVWFIVWAIPLPLFVRLSNSTDSIVYSIIYTIGCLISATVLLILISVNWGREGTFYLGLSGVDGGFSALYILIAALGLELVTGIVIVALLAKLARVVGNPKKAN